MGDSARLISIKRFAAGYVLPAALCAVLAPALTYAASPREFKAVGPTEPVKMGPGRKVAVEVYFDLQPTGMRFHLPAIPCMVTENNIQCSNFFAETYEPRVGGGSFETAMDRRNTYARMWIESQNDARIVVRVRGALSNSDDVIAHTDIPSGSPYGEGDWVDEWFYIYPDSTHIRHVKIYTGLASRSRPFGFNREPPAVVHETSDEGTDLILWLKMNSTESVRFTLLPVAA